MTIEKLQKIEKILTTFEKNLKNQLSLITVQAPLFLSSSSKLNDSLNNVETPVSFKCKEKKEWEVIHSLAKWKRALLSKYNFKEQQGIVANMKAIRKDEYLDFTHSYLVEQWDWEKIISKEDRTIEYLKQEVRKIYFSLKETTKVYSTNKELPDDIFFITSEELEDLYPNKSRKLREDAITKKYKVVFLIGVGWELKDGKPHDGRAPDYDDWKLNGDLLVWFEPLQKSLELSSMGIRVCENSIQKQLTHRGIMYETIPKFHKYIIDKKLPYTIGGGIGQSRLLMFIMDIKDITEIQPFTSF